MSLQQLSLKSVRWNSAFCWLCNVLICGKGKVGSLVNKGYKGYYKLPWKPENNLGNQYHKNTTKVASGIIEKLEEPHNIISQQIDETLNERQMKHNMK